MSETVIVEADSSVSQAPPFTPHLTTIAAILNDSDFIDFVTNAFGRTCDDAGRVALDPAHYLALLFFGFTEGCRSDVEIHRKANASKQMLQLLELDLDDEAPGPELIAHTRTLLGPRAHAAAIAWLNSRSDWSRPGASELTTLLPANAFLDYVDSLHGASSPSDHSHVVPSRTSISVERMFSPPLLKTVFAFAGNLVTTALIAGMGIWLLKWQVPGMAPPLQGNDWSPAMSLTVLRVVRAAAAVTFALSIVLMVFLLADARRRVRELRVPEPVRSLFIVGLAAIIVLITLLATLKQA